MSRRVLRVGAIIVVGLVGVGVATVVQQSLTPMPPTGPLAIVEPQIGSHDALNSGVLEITEDCVRLAHPDGSRVLLIWFRGAVTWNSGDRSIAVTTPDGGALTFRNGDAVSISGGGGSAAELERAGSWVRRPAPTCDAPLWFLAEEVRVAQQD